MQGKWDQAEKDYRKILEENSRYPGIHFRLARLLLSKPNPAPGFQDEAKKELQQELEIDPANAGAEYVLGELARETQDLPEAIRHFTKATQLNPSFADAYLGLGMSLLAQKSYADAVAPLQSAVKLQPENPAAHYGLATAYARTGRKEDAEHEFALQQQAAARMGGRASATKSDSENFRHNGVEFFSASLSPDAGRRGGIRRAAWDTQCLRRVRLSI